MDTLVYVAALVLCLAGMLLEVARRKEVSDKQKLKQKLDTALAERDMYAQSEKRLSDRIQQLNQELYLSRREISKLKNINNV